jgi:hypothetical protein
VILRRNLRHLTQDCPHAALVEGVSLEELLPSMDDSRVKPMFNTVDAAPLVDALDSPHVDTLLVAMDRLLRMCSSEWHCPPPSSRPHTFPLRCGRDGAGVHHGHLNAFLAVPAYEKLASMCPPATFLHAAQRALKGVLLDMTPGATATVTGGTAASVSPTSDGAGEEVEWRHGRNMAVAASLLHAYCVCNQPSAAFCEAVGERQWAGNSHHWDGGGDVCAHLAHSRPLRRRRHRGAVRLRPHPHPGGLPVYVHRGAGHGAAYSKGAAGDPRAAADVPPGTHSGCPVAGPRWRRRATCG